jgi:PP-loop superfamily ATP-utilizing enzyme
MHEVTINFPILFNTSEEIKFFIPQNQNIGVMISGGADSTLLFWLLLNENKNKNLNCNIIPFYVNRPNGAKEHSFRITNFLKNFLNVDILDPTAVGDSTLHHSKHIYSGLVDVKEKYNIDTIFVGGTQNPPAGAVGGDYPYRPSSSNYERFDLNPFLNCDKRHIIYLYIKYNLLELLDITHSCGNWQHGKCLNCFSCFERAWALSEVSKILNG